jgi:mRNA-degrading endonuclease RelE of RelBE toxin-antitoxin system
VEGLNLQPYGVLITVEVLRMERPNRNERDRILSFLEILTKNPECTGDYTERDDTGRLVQIKIVGGYAVTYWADHAVKEVKVTKIEKAD